ncbi:MAG: hypothetical protein MR051_05680 [Lentisphaeria bacterium]|nr:hypothetical protein [Lentisphaeria bacterium]
MESRAAQVIPPLRNRHPARRLAAGFFCLLPLLTCAAGTEDWEDGDLILRHGRGLWSELFRRASPRDRRFSHIGIVCTVAGRRLCVHAEADDRTGRGRVNAVPPERFLAEADAVGRFRLKLPRELRKKFAEAALEQLGVPFDWKFDDDDDSALYCTELAAAALKTAAPHLTVKRHNGLIPPDALTDPEIAEELPPPRVTSSAVCSRNP